MMRNQPSGDSRDKPIPFCQLGRFGVSWLWKAGCVNYIIAFASPGSTQLEVIEPRRGDTDYW